MASPREIQRLQRALDRLEPTLRREVQRAITRLQRKVTLQRLLAIVETGDAFAVRALLSSLSDDLRATTPTMRQAFALGAKAGAAALPATSVAFTLDLTNPLATQAAEQAAASLVTAVTEETRRAIRAIVARAFRDRIAGRDIAVLIRPLIGLTERQALAVVNRRAALLARGISSSRVQADLERYAARLIRQRATLIARTELATAATDGQREAWRQAQASGLLGRDMVKRWIVTPDDRLCPVCEPLDGQTRGLNEPFVVSKGAAVQGPPAHPQCRCALGLVRKRAAGRVAA